MRTRRFSVVAAEIILLLLLAACGAGEGPTANTDTPPAGTGENSGTGSAAPPPAQPPGVNIDQYGGSALLTCTATGWFHPEKIRNRWWFCDPGGNVFFAVAVGGIDAAEPATNDMGTSYAAVMNAKYPNPGASWGPQQNRRLLSWGFNSIGEDAVGEVSPLQICNTCPGWPGGEQPVKMPIMVEIRPGVYAASNLHNYGSGYMKDLIYGVNGHYNAYRSPLGDFFDPTFGQWVAGELQNDPVLSPYLNSPWTLGIFFDDSDQLMGFGGGPDFPTYPPGYNTVDLAYMLLIASPVQTFNPNPEGGLPAVIYADSKVYSKTAGASPPAVCSISSPCTLRDYLYKKYNGSIGALNAAWGSNYTTFDSAGQPVSGELIGVGDGKTNLFTHTLARTPVSPESVLIRAGGTAIAGDCPWFAGACPAGLAANSGAIEGVSGSPIATGDRPYLGALTQQNCGCSLPSQLTDVVVVYHTNPGFYSQPSNEQGIDQVAGQVIVVPSPQPDAHATGYDVYAASEPNSLGWTNFPPLRLQASNVPFGTNWVEPAAGLITEGPIVPPPPSSINYQAGQISVAFTTPPAPGTPITVNYTANGWMYGSGLMDEDGRHTQWLGTNFKCLQAAAVCDGKGYPAPDARPAVGADLDAWISQFSAEYFSTIHAAMKKYAPHVSYLGLDTIGAWAAPARKEILEGAAPYVDAVFTQWYAFAPNSQQELDYMEQYLGDKPLMNFLTMAANPDSCLWRHPNPPAQFATQQARGQAYASTMSGMLTQMHVSSTGTYPWIGSVWWALVDSWGEKADWGLISLEDNPYDGVCDKTAKTVDQWGYPCGGEEKNYGDVITPVKQANKIWLNVLTPQ